MCPCPRLNSHQQSPGRSEVFCKERSNMAQHAYSGICEDLPLLIKKYENNELPSSEGNFAISRNYRIAKKSWQ